MISVEYDNKRAVFWNCPSLFIPDWVVNFSKAYNAVEKGAAEYTKFGLPMPLKYITAKRYFENELAQQRENR